jgi:uncharacterized protein YkwD
MSSHRSIGQVLALTVVVSVTSCSPAPTPSLPQPGAPLPAAPCCAEVERGLLAELNAARTNPRSFAARLESRLPHFRGVLFHRPGEPVATRTQEGAAAVREAVAALRATLPRAALERSPGMSQGARDHVADQGPRGATGHTGRDGSTFAVRVNRYGRWGTRLTESISYGPSTAHDVVAELLIDDGVRDRGHRHNLLDPTVKIAGIACGRHTTYRAMCVIALAGSYAEAVAR